jgi:hypothetical protein
MTCGYRVFVCSNMAFFGEFTPVLAEHSKSFFLIDCISVSEDRRVRMLARYEGPGIVPKMMG